MIDTSTVRAVSAMTARWARAGVSSGTALTAAGVWPLLALLAGGAAGGARAELEDALGVRAEYAARAGRELLAGLGAMDGVDVASGVWVRADKAPLRPEWAAGLPEGARGLLTADAARDAAVLDAWAADHTRGQVPRMPVEVAADTLLLLAGALLVQTGWTEPFERRQAYRGRRGGWPGREVDTLERETPALEQVGVAPETPVGELTLLGVAGDNGVDVHLALGPVDAAPGEVIAAAVETLQGSYRRISGRALPYGAPGPGLGVEQGYGWEDEPRLEVTTVPFTVAAEHDLLELAGVFGLEAAADASRGHFPGVSDAPLAVRAAKQAITASFTAEGFRCAAVSVVGLRAGGRATRRVRVISADFDRPFAFVAVHRESGLVLTAGWVTEPEPATPVEYVDLSDLPGEPA